MTDRPKPIAVTEGESGAWVPFSHNHPRTNPPKVHAIMFEDGSVWDAFNGWREQQMCPHCLGTGRK